VRASEGADTPAGRQAVHVLDALALVVAEAGTHVRAHTPGAVVARLALALEVARLGEQQAVRVGVAVHFHGVHLARVRTVVLARLQTHRRAPLALASIVIQFL